MMSYKNLISSCVAIAIAVTPGLSRAQQVGLAYTNASGSRNSDLATLHGARLEVSHTIRHVLLVRVGAHQLARGGESYGSTCVGLILPGTCAPEPLDQRRRLTFGSVGVGVTSNAKRTLSNAAYADALIGRAYTDDRGRTTGEHRTASQPLRGTSIGVELRARVAKTGAAARVSSYVGFSRSDADPHVQQCVDCFVPFGGAFEFRSWYAGVSLGR
jgi:hypothetical protein